MSHAYTIRSASLRLRTVFFDVPYLLDRLLEDSALVGLDVEVVHVVDVGEDQLGQFLDVLVLLFAVSPLRASLGAAGHKSCGKDGDAPFN